MNYIFTIMGRDVIYTIWFRDERYYRSKSKEILVNVISGEDTHSQWNNEYIVIVSALILLTIIVFKNVVETMKFRLNVLKLKM